MRNDAHLFVALSALTVAIICSGHNADYTTSSNQPLNYYHYPTPQGVRLHETSLSSVTQQYYEEQQRPYSFQNYHQPPQQQQQRQPHRQHPSMRIEKAFTSPMLENVAFTMALSRQGYIVDDVVKSTAFASSASASASATAPTSITLSTTNTIIGAQLHSNQRQRQHHHHQHPHTYSKYSTHSNAPLANSQNVKLPLPLDVTPITFEPFPLQAGAPYSTLRGLTSYGTTYPQRRR